VSDAQRREAGDAQRRETGDTATPAAPAAPAAPDAPDAAGPEWQRLSRRMLLVHPVQEIPRALPALLGVVVAGSRNGNGDL
jgi:putative membrane protein